MIRPAALTLLALLPFANTAAAQTIETRPYQIFPGSTYTFKPSPFLPIPGGMPSPSQLDFGVHGFFDVEFGDAAYTARIVNAALTLTGNEAIQMDPPNPFTPVTADNVEDFLEARLFHNMFVLAPWDQYRDETHSQFFLYDFLQGGIELRGGFDSTFVDGIGMLFNVNAQQIPEPAAALLLAIAVPVLIRMMQLAP